MIKQYPSDFVTDPKKAATVDDFVQDGIRVIIKSVRGSHFCVYLGVPDDSPAAGLGSEEVPIECHGGLTFAGDGDGTYLPKSRYWYGYDFAHAGDQLDSIGRPEGFEMPVFEGDHRWTLKEVKEDTWGSVYSAKQFMDVAEKIIVTHRKPKAEDV